MLHLNVLTPFTPRQQPPMGMVGTVLQVENLFYSCLNDRYFEGAVFNHLIRHESIRIYNY